MTTSAQPRGAERRAGSRDAAVLVGVAAAGAVAALLATRRRARPSPGADEPNRHAQVAQLQGSPERRYYTGSNLDRAVAIADLRARTHEKMPRFVLEYLEGGASEEATLARERTAYADWRFMPRQLIDVSHRTLATTILGKPAAMPLIVAPTGLNGLFGHHADTALAKGANSAGVPFCQSTMSNDTMAEIAAAAPGLRHWWQLYVFGGDEVWRAILDRADDAGCEALLLTTNTQIFGNREWETRTQSSKTRPSLPTTLNAALHPTWLAGTIVPDLGLPSFRNVVDFVPKEHRGFFASSSWIRENQPTSMDWDTVKRIRDRWKKPFLLKGILHPKDVELALAAGVDGIVLSSHGGRQLDWTIAPLDLLPEARRIVGDRMALFVAGGIRRGTDIIKAVALGADAVLAGRAMLYGVCAGGAAGVERAIAILHQEMLDAMGLLGVAEVSQLGPEQLVRSGSAVR